ncbi:LysR substrate-binding domain-containing protein [Nocardioides sp. SYSU D00038]|uniref:LysR family transcriptional regulator n=1 Tax=Nocardioides sp. SYSU D00038 TaxID=2812554 RepID=UPI0027DB235D|nr:LysR substrate-binding domain-containing protein [Nocardioides sp. SYSU D00038]
MRYFVAVADTLNFGRAAQRLHIAQPVLSRQIAVLERELGAKLFDRSTNGTTLTAAGRDVLEEARTLLLRADALERRARRASRDVEHVRIGFMPGLVVTPLVQGLRTSFAGIEVELVRTGWDDQVATILDGRVDIGLLRLPVVGDGVRVEGLFEEPRVAVVPMTHPLAEASELSIDDLAAFELLQSPEAVPEWRDARRRRGLSIRAAHSYPHEVEVKLERVAAGLGVAILPASTARFYTRPDLVTRAVSGLAPGTVGIGRAEDRDGTVLDRAVELAHTLGASLATGRVLDGIA